MSSISHPGNAFQLVIFNVPTSGDTTWGGTTGVSGFSESLKGIVGSVEQALSSSIIVILRNLNWFFIEYWLKLYFINIQDLLKNVGNTTRNRCSNNFVIHYHMVDFTPKKKYQEKRLTFNIRMPMISTKVDRQ